MCNSIFLTSIVFRHSVLLTDVACLDAFCRTTSFWFPAPDGSEALEADENQDGDEAEGSLEESGSTTSPPPANSEDKGLEKKRKHVGDLASSSTSVQKDASGEHAAARDSEPDMFELLDS
jgi:hypothetical protein